MVVTSYQIPGQIRMEKDGVPWFDTALKTFGLVTAKALTLSGVTVNFPKPSTDNAVFWEGSSLGGTPAQFFECMRAYITTLPEESGPQAVNPAYTKDLPDIYLGDIVAGADYLDVQVRITRTHDPVGDTTAQAFNSGILGEIAKVIPPTGIFFPMVGVSCPLEECYPMARSFAIVLVPDANPANPGKAYLRRRQSWGGFLDALNWATGNSNSQSGAYTWGTTKGFPVTMLATHSLTFVDGNFTEAGFTWQRGGSNFNSQQLPLTDNTDFSSVYSMDFVITPGFFKTPAVITAPTNKCMFKIGDQQFPLANGATATATFPCPPVDATRTIILGITGGYDATGGLTHPTGVTVNGISATKLQEVSFNATTSKYVQLWVVALPTGTSPLSVVVTHSASTNFTCSIAAYAAYHLNSTTPFSMDTCVQVSPDTMTVSTTGDSWVLAVLEAAALTGSPPAITGMDLIGAVFSKGAGSNASASFMTLGFETGDGTSKSASVISGLSTTVVGILACFD